jgi:hypothetical protein
MRIFAGGAHRPLRGMPARALREVGGACAPYDPVQPPAAEGRSAFCGGRGPKAPCDPLVRPLRGRTTKEGPHKRARPLFGNTRALEAGGDFGDRSPGPGTTAGPGPRPLERTGRLLPRATCAPPLKNAVELGCLHETYQRIAASVRNEREAGGQGRLSCRGRGPIRRRSGAGARGLLDPGRSSARAFGAPSHRLKAWVPTR